MKARKIIAMLLTTAMMLIFFSACGSSTPAQTDTPAQTSSTEAAAPADNTVYKLKINYNSPELTPETCLETNFAQTIKAYLEEHAPGRFDVQIYPGAQLGTFSEALAGVSDGSIESALVNISTLINNDANLNVWQIPGSIKSIEECNMLLSDPAARETFSKVESDLGITVKTAFTAGARHFTNNVREIKVPSDMNGIVFRVMQSELYVKMVESLGAIATPMSSSELYSALQNGVVEGQENPTAFIISDLTYEVQNYMVTDGHVYSISPFVVNNKWYNSLPEDLQQVFDQAVEVATESAIAFVDKQEVEGLEWLRENGMTVYEPTEAELEEWHTAVYNGSYDYIVDLIGQQPVDDFMALINAVRG